MEAGTIPNKIMSLPDEMFLNLQQLFKIHDEIIKQIKQEFENDVKKFDEILFYGMKAENSISTEDCKTPEQIKKRSKRGMVVHNKRKENVDINNISSENESIKFKTPRAITQNLDLNGKQCFSNFDSFNDNNLLVNKKLKNVVEKSTKEFKNVISDEHILPIESDENKESTNCDAENLFATSEFANGNNNMPPPVAPAPKTRGRKKETDILLDFDLLSSIKKERVSVDNNILENDGINSYLTTDSNNSKKTGQNVKVKVARKFPKPKIIKQEKISISPNNSNISNNSKQNRINSSDKQRRKSNGRGESVDSVYEDARSPVTKENFECNSKQTCNPSNSVNATVKQFSNLHIAELEYNDLPVSKSDELLSEKIDDATFVSAKDVSGLMQAIIVHTDTIIKNNNPTANVMIDNKNYNDNTIIIKNDANATFNIQIDPEKNPSETYIRSSILSSDKSGNIRGSSIMTEDDLQQNNVVDEVPKIKYKPKPKSKMNKNEIFNPCIKSPMKKKIEAFEKIAGKNIEQNPLKRPLRGQGQNNQMDKNEIKKTSKNTTPTFGRHLDRVGISSQSSTSNIGTPTMGTLRTLPNSASNTMKCFSAINKASVGDYKKGNNPLKQMAAERKKKREEKQQQAAILREQKEKERSECLKRLLEKREEKKKILEQKRNLGEIQKNLKILEEKTEYNRKIEKQKLMDKKVATPVNAKKREDEENLRIQMAKKEMQLKYNNKQKLLQNKVIDLQQYNFNMLNTDDETDDEDEISKTRPPLPEWSKKQLRQQALIQQAYLPTEIIDNFFSVKPLTLDLREIFPTINDRYCRRNSSAYWSTPPRYSQLPKY